MQLSGRTHDEVHRGFRWEIPERFNIADAVCDRHVGTGRTALLFEADGRPGRVTFEELAERSRRLANALAAHGVAPGDRVGILLPQCPEAVVAHLAAYRMGAIALPLFTLFGPEALEYRLNDSGARAVISDAEGIAKLLALGERLHAAPLLIGIGDRLEGRVLGLQSLLDAASPDHARVDSAAEDPALIVYTSGTTGNPKGVLHAHRMLLGHLPGVSLPHEFLPQPGDAMWTPADWAWAGGLMDVLLPGLYFGLPVLAMRMAKFDPEEAFALLARHGIRNTFLPPTALKMMRGVPRPRERFGHALRSVASGGERLGAEMLDWGREAFDVTINEFYGQTEANLTVAACASIMATPDGSMGRAVPGHVVAILDEDARPVAPGTTGTIGVRAPDPVFFLRYWNRPEATAAKYRNGWLLTGDVGHADGEGNLWFHARDDDVIISAGYRIGPAEIEECLAAHPAVAMVAVVGVPDALRGEVVKAFIVPRDGVVADAALHAEVQAYVKTRLSGHEYPRQIEFRDALPMTVTGKVRRKDLRDAAARATPDAGPAVTDPS